MYMLETSIDIVQSSNKSLPITIHKIISILQGNLFVALLVSVSQLKASLICLRLIKLAKARHGKICTFGKAHSQSFHRLPVRTFNSINLSIYWFFCCYKSYFFLVVAFENKLLLRNFSCHPSFFFMLTSFFQCGFILLTFFMFRIIMKFPFHNN